MSGPNLPPSDEVEAEEFIRTFVMSADWRERFRQASNPMQALGAIWLARDAETRQFDQEWFNVQFEGL